MYTIHIHAFGIWQQIVTNINCFTYQQKKGSRIPPIRAPEWPWGGQTRRNKEAEGKLQFCSRCLLLFSHWSEFCNTFNFHHQSHLMRFCGKLSKVFAYLCAKYHCCFFLLCFFSSPQPSALHLRNFSSFEEKSAHKALFCGRDAGPTWIQPKC